MSCDFLIHWKILERLLMPPVLSVLRAAILLKVFRLMHVVQVLHHICMMMNSMRYYDTIAEIRQFFFRDVLKRAVATNSGQRLKVFCKKAPNLTWKICLSINMQTPLKSENVWHILNIWNFMEKNKRPF